MRTIFITCIRGIIARNILATGAFRILRDRQDFRIILLAPTTRVAILQKEFGAPNVEVAGLKTPPLKGMDLILWTISTNLLWSGTREVQRRAKLARDGNYFDYLVSKIFAFFGRFYPIRYAFRLVYAKLDPGDEFDELFRCYRPDLFFSTDIYDIWDMKLVRAAKRHHTPVVGMVRSWDNVTSKTLLNIIPDYMLVNAGRIREELIAYGDIPAEKITIIGVPHYDHYRDPNERTPRSDFIKQFGLDPTKPLILFVPPSDRYLKGDPVAPLVMETVVPLGASMLIRMPLVGKSELEGMKPPPNVAFDMPSNSSEFTEVHFDRAADRHLADSLSASDLVIAWASSMIIDAVVFDKPVVLVGFDKNPRHYGNSIQQYYDYDHQKRIIETGGCWLAESPEELATIVREYLQDPSRDRAGRVAIVREYCDVLDGKSGVRLADVLVGVLARDVRT